MKPAVAILLAALVPWGWAHADIYGYVDENGVAHLSNTPLDHRYYLFKKESRPALLPGSNDAADVPVPAPRRTTRVNPADRKYYTPLISAVAKEQKVDPATAEMSGV